MRLSSVLQPAPSRRVVTTIAGKVFLFPAEEGESSLSPEGQVGRCSLESTPSHVPAATVALVTDSSATVSCKPAPQQAASAIILFMPSSGP